MKFKRLKSEFQLLVNCKENEIELASLERLRDGLEEKKAKYTRKLKKGISMEKRDSVEVKLEELQGMLKEIKTLIAKSGTD